MCEYFGYEVTKLERVRIMNIRFGAYPFWVIGATWMKRKLHRFLKCSNTPAQRAAHAHDLLLPLKTSARKTAREQEYGHRASSPINPPKLAQHPF